MRKSKGFNYISPENKFNLSNMEDLALVYSDNDIDFYRYDVQSKESSNIIFANTGPAHAAIVLERIFARTQNLLRLYAFNYDGTITNQDSANCLLEMKKFIFERKGDVKIILDQIPETRSRVLQFLIDCQTRVSNVIEIKQISGDMKLELEKIENEKEHDIHFQIGDTNMFRYEWNKEKHKAICSFNQSDKAQELITLFDKHFEECKSIKF